MVIFLSDIESFWKFRLRGHEIDRTMDGKRPRFVEEELLVAGGVQRLGCLF